MNCVEGAGGGGGGGSGGTKGRGNEKGDSWEGGRGGGKLKWKLECIEYFFFENKFTCTCLNVCVVSFASYRVILCRARSG